MNMHESDLKVPATSLSLWEKSLAALQGEIDPQVYSAYIRPLALRSFNQETAEFVIAAPSRLVCNHVDRNFGERLSRIHSDKLGIADVRVRFSVAEGEEPRPRPASHVVVKKIRPREEDDVSREQRLISGRLNPKYLFSNFVVGNNNQFCHAAARRVAEEPGRSYNPLFIYGGVGLGKTHLLHAIGNAVLSQRPAARVCYLSSEMFTNDLIHSLRHAKMDQFKARMRGVEVLLLDDIQFMCGKERTQEEFFHTFNALYNAKHQIVITSDKLPQEIPGIEERLLTRFSWGLTADLQAPDFETRVAILKRKATLDGFVLPQDVAHWIAERVSSNVRELEGALTRLHALSSLQNEELNVSSAERALTPLLQPKQVSVSVEDIKKAVAAHFGIKVSEIVSKRRTRNLSFPRHVAMFLCRKHTTASYPEIGGRFGGRDHSSVIHAANVVAGKVAADSAVAELIRKIEERLFGNAR
jgi:chromosomal replication initiator protein